jgi:hypothetical protein
MLRDGAKDLENIDRLMEQTKKKLKIGQSLYSFLQVISISIFEKEPVNQLVSNSDSHFKDSDFSNQLILF